MNVIEQQGRMVELRRLADLVPYERNPRTHSEAQIEQLMKSIREFGWTNPMLVDGNKVIAGHGRRQAAIRLQLEQVPCIDLHGLTEDQKRAYVIADNKLALNASWDLDLLAAELHELEAAEFDMSVIGFDDEELNTLFDEDDDERYTRKFAAPAYEPSERKPEISELFNHAKARELAERIRASKVSEEEKRFLMLAAERHTVFDFRNIADYYAHASAEMQDLMEQSALVIIDLDKAIINGFVIVGKKIMQQYAKEHADAQEVPEDVPA